MNLLKKIRNWEQWPFKVLYAPITPVWIWYAFRSRSIWFFTPSNPKLTFGGMEGEPKKEMHELLPPHLCPRYFNVDAKTGFDQILQNLKEKQIPFPLIVKPEVGGQGILFRKINDLASLKFYHENVPVEYVIQEFIQYPLEVSLFYYRYPGATHGTITGFLQKIPMQVVGDGVQSLKELVEKHPKASKRMEELEGRHQDNFSRILARDEKYMLSHAANHNRGAQFIDLKNEIDDSLTEILDQISVSINDFFYGRYDIMCQSIEGLKKGKDFIILEYNGCGAEPNHFYDTGYTLWGAWKEILKHWKVLYQISRENHKAGISYWPTLKGYRFIKETRKYYKIIKEADRVIP